jgi:uncharacterized caspase-like protein
MAEFGLVLLLILIVALTFLPKAPASRAPESAPDPASGIAVRGMPGERRVALVVGNAAYETVGPLANPVNDALAMAGTLDRLGFEVIEKHNIGVVQMREALRNFEEKASGADWALVYFAGHGMEMNGRNWLIPVDARIARSTDLPDETIALDQVLERMSGAKKLRMVILDACRTSPFIARMTLTRGMERKMRFGLAPVEPSYGEVVFYAARHGSIAQDGTGQNSPFAQALVKHMGEEGMELGRFFRRVTSSVIETTGSEQEPYHYGRIPDADFYFKPERAIAAAAR